jgi:hypothetical protein
MSCDQRTLTDIGRKLINSNLKPLSAQLVDANDSVLGSIAGSRSKKPTTGLTVTYKDMIQKAFRKEYWTAAGVGDLKYSQMESNFSLFFGLSVQLYEATLVSNNTPFDQFMEGNKQALTKSQQIGLSLFVGQRGCATCHSGPELTKASVASVSAEPIESMLMDNNGKIFHNKIFRTWIRLLGICN